MDSTLQTSESDFAPLQGKDKSSLLELATAPLPEPHQLFELAQQHAIVGDFVKKQELYEIIFNHPLATPDDRARVEIYRADLLRRKGDVDTAIEQLEKIPAPLDKTALFELFFARAWAYGGRFDTTQDRGALAKAIQNSLEVVSIVDSSADYFPADKKAYAYEGAIPFLISEQRLSGGNAKIQEQIESLLKRFSTEIENIPDGAIKTRATTQYLSTLSTAAFESAQFTQAARHAFEYYQISVGDYYKMAAGLMYLAAVSSDSKPAENPAHVEEIREYLCSAWHNPTIDVAAKIRVFTLNRDLISPVRAKFPEFEGIG